MLSKFICCIIVTGSQNVSVICKQNFTDLIYIFIHFVLEILYNMSCFFDAISWCCYVTLNKCSRLSVSVFSLRVEYCFCVIGFCYAWSLLTWPSPVFTCYCYNRRMLDSLMMHQPPNINLFPLITVNPLPHTTNLQQKTYPKRCRHVFSRGVRKCLYEWKG